MNYKIKMQLEKNWLLDNIRILFKELQSLTQPIQFIYICRAIRNIGNGLKVFEW